MKAARITLTYSKKLFYSLLTISIFIFLPFVVFTLLTSKTTLLNGIRSYVVMSGSMEPSIPTGSVIYTNKIDFYSKGDIIAFEKEGKTISHRVLGLSAIGNELYYSTKGDANNTSDNSLVARSEVVGRTFFSIPYLGKLVMVFKTPIGFAVGIALPAFLFVVVELWNIKNEIEKSTEKKIMERLRTAA